MCGFAFVASNYPRPLDMMITMGKTIAHRGPDDHGHALWSKEHGYQNIPKDGLDKKPPYGNVLFHHRRLSILDLSHHGHQPMHFKGLTLLFNGEIYNYKELRHTIPLPFDGSGDTEVLLKGLYHFGVDFIPKLRGMFSFVLFDERTQDIILARDHFGIKPLYYTQDSDGLYVASEIKALLPLQKGRSIDRDRVHDFLYLGNTEHHEQTCFKGIYQYPAGSFSVIPLQKCHEKMLQTSYWRAPLEYDESSPRLSCNDAKDQIITHLSHSLTLHTRSDVPIISFLSGGLDSSLLICLSKHMGLSIQHTLSYIASDKKISEEPYVDAVTEHLNINNHKVFLENQNLQEDIDRLIFHQDQPFGSTSIYAQFKLFEAVKNLGFKVTLDGQGADEIFAGYGMYRHFQRAKDFLKSPFSNIHLLFKSPKSDLYRMLSYSMGWGVSHNPFVKASSFSFFERGYPTLHHFLKDTLERSNLPSLLRYMDRNSMAFSIESRVPFLLPEIVEAAYALSSNMLIHGQHNKYILFEAGKPFLPQKIYQRRTKLSFATPESTLLAQSQAWIHDTLDNATSSVINVQKMKKALEQQQFSNAFWKSLCYLRWAKIFQMEDA